MPPKSATPKAKTGSAPAHASFQDMITDAIINLKERSGSSRAALKKYVKANNTSITVNDKLFDSLFNRAIRSGVEKGVFVQPKGASGTTKLAKKEPKPATAKPKKEAKPKTEKKPAVKKTTTTTKKTTATKPKVAAKPKKTAAPKKEAKPKVAKKPAATKPKKVAAPKTAPAVVEKPTVLSKTKSGRVTKSAPKTAPKKTATKKTPVKKATPKKA